MVSYDAVSARIFTRRTFFSDMVRDTGNDFKPPLRHVAECPPNIRPLLSDGSRLIESNRSSVGLLDSEDSSLQRSESLFYNVGWM